jgi:hypothetical protein
MEWNGTELKGPKNNEKEKKRQNLCKPLYVKLQFFTKIYENSRSLWLDFVDTTAGTLQSMPLDRRPRRGFEIE